MVGVAPARRTCPADRRPRGSSAASLSAGDLLAHGSVVWLANIITFGLLFWQLDGGGPRVRAEHGRPDPDYAVVILVIARAVNVLGA